ncbi:MAG: hypothetical protein HeimC3_14980 [Candidatus Heimdallarchaeota archaeon LC_3]|nr:MAG: hypothetical protein HeimC3_14980 [Candidatus Heimdallarchaeota archaeon LC_3]
MLDEWETIMEGEKEFDPLTLFQEQIGAEIACSFARTDWN